MCGITGFVGPWPVSLLQRMASAVAHRGPDGEGTFFDPAAGIALGHRRLAIIDTTEGGAQPMVTPDGRFAVTYNGEIYNYLEIRAELESAGSRFRTASDTEVLLQAFARYGSTVFPRLRGIFAAAFWDARERRLTLVRDSVGVKPLYYAALPKGFLFGSEIKSLVLCPDLPRDLDCAAVADHVAFNWTASEATMLRSVRKLRPGEILTVDGSGVRRSCFEVRRMSPTSVDGDRAALLRDRIDAVVREQMVADVEVGALLSGGVDSSAIVAAMCRAKEPAKIATFCAVVSKPDTGADNFGADRDFARMVAGRLGVRLVEVPTDIELIDALPRMIWALDEPTADFAAWQTYLLARAAREAGIKVLLSGVGGDDVFTGYGRHRLALLYRLLDRAPPFRRLAGLLLSGIPPTNVTGRRLSRIGDLLRLDEEAMALEAMSFSAISADRRSTLFTPPIRTALASNLGHESLRQSLVRTRGRHPVERMIDLELSGFLPDHNLNYTDKMAMLAGVEVRVPLADPSIIEFAAATPLGARISLWQTKKILRRSQVERLPRAVLTRSKQGFGVPVRAWLQGAARPLLDDLTSDSALRSRGLFEPAAVAALKRDVLAGRIDAAWTLFPMMAIELWCRALDASPTAATVSGSGSAVPRVSGTR
jgi:asparagine synthase (glutamine-hydrolysing)